MSADLAILDRQVAEENRPYLPYHGEGYLAFERRLSFLASTGDDLAFLTLVDEFFRNPKIDDIAMEVAKLDATPVH